jgi:SAM-dependent methyltransferase
VAATYRAARALPADSVPVWVVAIRDAVRHVSVRRALDVGAGTGRFTRVLADAVGGRVVAIEPSAGMVAEHEVGDRPAVQYVRAAGEALPIATGSVDVVLLSMSYHQLRDPKTARTEFHRVVRPGGAVLLRTPTQETLGQFQWAPFFPESVAFDMPRMPAHDEAVVAFRECGFRCRRSTMVRQRIAANLAEYAARIRSRALSSMQALPDDVWARRLAVFEEHCRTAADGPVDEPVNLFVFER